MDQDESKQCIVCFEPEEEGAPLYNPCKSCLDLRLHDECLQRWLSNSNSCPTCRQPLLEEVEEEEPPPPEAPDVIPLPFVPIAFPIGVAQRPVELGVRPPTELGVLMQAVRMSRARRRRPAPLRVAARPRTRPRHRGLWRALVLILLAVSLVSALFPVRGECGTLGTSRRAGP